MQTKTCRKRINTQPKREPKPLTAASNETNYNRNQNRTQRIGRQSRFKAQIDDDSCINAVVLKHRKPHVNRTNNSQDKSPIAAASNNQGLQSVSQSRFQVRPEQHKKVFSSFSFTVHRFNLFLKVFLFFKKNQSRKRRRDLEKSKKNEKRMKERTRGRREKRENKKMKKKQWGIYLYANMIHVHDPLNHNP